MFAAKRGGVAGGRQSLFLLLTKRGYGDCFLDVCKTGNLRSGTLELKHSHFSVTTKPLNKWSPHWLEAMKPPAWGRLSF